MALAQFQARQGYYTLHQQRRLTQHYNYLRENTYSNQNLIYSGHFASYLRLKGVRDIYVMVQLGR